MGHVLGEVGSLPNIFTEIEISYFLLRRLLGVKTEGDKKGARVSYLILQKIKKISVSVLDACLKYSD